MIACVDVQYGPPGSSPAAHAGIVVFEAWDAAIPRTRLRIASAHVEPYVPGAFYRRELPCIRAALNALDAVPEVVIVDGHVWLAPGVPGLGAHLRSAEPRIATVVGVAKTCFRGAPALPVLRGHSKTPVFVDECGAPVDAPKRVAHMHGPFRIPTMLGLCDRLCRGRDG
jgi:deoxyribonuclease V